ncbi:MAG TPA: VOC family protein, partial [Holophagaceae bacterium]|nr:VOC family protein [Holophagaceae bacterium]
HRHALHFGDQKINLHRVETPIDPLVKHAAPGTADLCFLVDGELDGLIAHVQSLGIEIFEGPGHRSGAVGSIRSAYCYDPDENLIELAERV